MQCETSLIGRKRPRDATTFPIALAFQRVAAPTQGGQAIHPARHTASWTHADLDFSPSQPAAVFGGEWNSIRGKIRRASAEGNASERAAGVWVFTWSWTIRRSSALGDA